MVAYQLFVRVNIQAILYCSSRWQAGAYTLHTAACVNIYVPHNTHSAAAQLQTDSSTVYTTSPHNVRKLELQYHGHWEKIFLSAFFYYSVEFTGQIVQEKNEYFFENRVYPKNNKNVC